MNCRPHKFPSERCVVDPFINCLNILEGKDYTFVSMPDRVHRNSPQPEAIYEDKKTKSKIVVERKCIIYPKNYAKLHNNKHYIIDCIYANLPDRILNSPYILNLDYYYEGSKKELAEHATQIANKIIDRFNILENIGFVCFTVDQCDYFLHKKNSSNFDDSSRWDSLVIITEENLPRFNPNHPPLKDYLDNSLIKMFGAIKRKMQSYSEYRKILLINRHGNIRRSPPVNWRNYFKELCIDIPICEIWDSWIETPDYSETSYWIHDRFYPCDDISINIADDIWIPVCSDSLSSEIDG